MEEKVIKLVAQLGVIALLIWIVAAAIGKRDEMSDKKHAQGGGGGHKWSKGDRWANGPCVAEAAQRGSYFPSPLAPQTRY